MNRNVFIKRVVRYLLFVVLAIIAMITGSRSSFGADCSSCAGKGICQGDIDCSKYIRR